MLRNTCWQKEIRRAAALKSVKVPKEQKRTSKTDPTPLENIFIYGDFSRATIRLSAFGMADDMQKNAAAFEAWALALLVHCKVAQVVIEVGPGVDRTTPAFQRFCSRLVRFEALYRGAVVVEDRTLLVTQPLVIADRPLEPGAASRGERRRKLAASIALQRTFQLDAPPRCDVCLDRFGLDGPSGMLGVRGDTLVGFAVKFHDDKSDPRPGLVSHALYQAGLMRDALLGALALDLAATENALTTARVAACTKIEVVLLADRYHPLVAAPGLLDSLNDAMARAWTDVPVTFRRWIVAGRPPVEPDFLFVDANAR